MNYFLERLKEPSTYAGFAAFACGMQHQLATMHSFNTMSLVSILGGVIAAFSPEGGKGSGSQGMPPAGQG